MELSNVSDKVASGNNLKLELSKTADNVASINNKHNTNVAVVGNDLKYSQFNQLYIRNEIYNNIIKKIDKLFCGMVSRKHIHYL